MVYQRVTIDTVQRGGTTEWRIVGWIRKDQRLTVAYCPNEEMALVIKKVLEESGQSRRAASPKSPGEEKGT